jgi:NifU-like protein involved in Fe-S cluster formation
MLQRHRDNKRHGNTARPIQNRMTMEANTRDIGYYMHPKHTKEENRPLLCGKEASFVCGNEVSFILSVNK